MRKIGYSEEDGLVVLTLTTPDYELLLMLLGAATGIAAMTSTRMPCKAKSILQLANRLNEGNKNYTPYK